MNVLGGEGVLVKGPSTWEKRLLFLVGWDRGWLLEEVPFELILDGWFSCVRRNGSGKIVGTGSCKESWGRIWTLVYSHWGITEQFYRKECHVQTCVSEYQMDAGNVKHGHHLHSALYLTKGLHSCCLILSSNVSINEFFVCLFVGWFFKFSYLAERQNRFREIRCLLYTNAPNSWVSGQKQVFWFQNLLLILQDRCLLRRLLQSAGLEVMRSNQGVAVKTGMAMGRGRERRGG